MESEILKDILISEIKEYPNNYLNHDKNVEHIKNSLNQFGYIKTSIVVDENNILLCGHGTLRAIKELNWDKIPEIKRIVGLSEGQKKAYRIIDNETGKGAEIILPNLELELKDIKIELPDLSIIDFGLDLNLLNNEQYQPENKEKEVGELLTENECPKCGYKY
jgi:ParB-like chromosome segregation protein Spo0J